MPFILQGMRHLFFKGYDFQVSLRSGNQIFKKNRHLIVIETYHFLLIKFDMFIANGSDRDQIKKTRMFWPIRLKIFRSPRIKKNSLALWSIKPCIHKLS